MTRKIAIAILFIFYFCLWILVGFVISPLYGIWYGLAFALILFAIIAFYGEKIILYVAQARYINDDDVLVFRVRNLAYLNEIPEVKVYWSNTFSFNVYCCHSFKGTPSLIIGKALYHYLSKNELNGLIYSSLQQIKNKEALNRTLFNLLMMNLLIPLKLVSLISKRIQQKHFFQIFLLPTYYLKNALYDNAKKLMETDREVVRLSGLKYEYASAIFKVSNLEARGGDELSNFVMSHMSVVENKNTFVLKDLIFNSVTVKERLRDLDVAYL